MWHLVLTVCLLVFCIDNILSLHTYDCEWKDGKFNSTFNLCELRLTNETISPYYEVHDKRATPNVTSFEYTFNVAADIAATINEDSCYNLTQRANKGWALGYCNNVFNYTCIGSITNITTTTAAYQRFPSRSSCWRLHDGATKPVWSLIDSTDPTKGVQLTYTNGDWCPAGGKNRELTLILHCANDYSNRFDKEERIEELETCDYAVELYTIHGCPTSCPYVDEQLCNGQGLCEFDYSNNASKCFCYEGYYGDSCSDTEDTDKVTIYNDDDEQYVGGLIIVVILLVVMLAILTYLWLRLSNANKGIVKSDIVKKLVSKKKGSSNNQNSNAGNQRAGQQLQSIDKEDSYDDEERVAV